MGSNWIIFVDIVITFFVGFFCMKIGTQMEWERNVKANSLLFQQFLDDDSIDVNTKMGVSSFVLRNIESEVMKREIKHNKKNLKTIPTET